MKWSAIVILFSIHFHAISCRLNQLEDRNLNRDSAPALSRYPYVYSTVPSWFRPPKFDNTASEGHSTGSSGRTTNWNRRTGTVGNNAIHSSNSWNSGTNAGSAVAPHRVYQNSSHEVIVLPRRFDPRPEEMRNSNAMLYKQTDGKLLFMGAMNVTTPKPANYGQRSWHRTFQTTTSKPQIHGNYWGGLRFTTQRSQNVYSTVPSWFRPPKFDNTASDGHSTGSSDSITNWNRRTGTVGNNARHSSNSWNSGTNAGSAAAPHRVYQNSSHEVIVLPRRFDPRPEEMRNSNAMLYKQKDGNLLFMGAMNVTTPKPANHVQRNWHRTFQTTTLKPQIHGNYWGGLRFTTQRSQIDRRYENRRDNLPSQNTRSDQNYLQIQFSAKPPRRESSNSRRWNVYTTPYSFRRGRIHHY